MTKETDQEQQKKTTAPKHSKRGVKGRFVLEGDKPKPKPKHSGSVTRVKSAVPRSGRAKKGVFEEVIVDGKPEKRHFMLEDIADLRRVWKWDSRFAEFFFEEMGFGLMSYSDIAVALGFDIDTISLKMKAFPTLKNAYERGMSRLKAATIRSLALEARCGNVKAAELILERRFREEWGKTITVDTNQPVNYIIPAAFVDVD